ncbi:MAG: nuclease PIN, partial [Hyphomicrobiales bacterium]|nr:nuclease PIN [Hyphomicrobiales bacterium]
MLGWFQKLMPREDNFFEMYTRHMATVTAGAVELRGLLRKEGDFAAHASEIGRQERLADEIM